MPSDFHKYALGKPDKKLAIFRKKKRPSTQCWIMLLSSAGSEALNFKRFVKPREGAIWNDNVTSIHRLHQNHPSIIGADGMDTVWEQFVWWYENNMKSGEVAILVAYNGKTCNLKWLWKLTQAPRSLYDLLATMAYFMDPLKVIKQYVGCKVNPKHSKLDSLELGVVWK